MKILTTAICSFNVGLTFGFWILQNLIMKEGRDQTVTPLLTPTAKRQLSCIFISTQTFVKLSLIGIRSSNSNSNLNYLKLKFM